MHQFRFTAANLEALMVGRPEDARALVVLLHGYAMRPEDLEPFAHSLRVPALFCFPRGPQPAQAGSFAWWPIDEERRTRELAFGPRDLFRESPAPRPALRAQLREFLASVRRLNPLARLVLGGFSQGGMMACDAVLCGGECVDGLVLLSASRIALNEWSARRDALRGLPVLITHGRHDPDLSFAAGEALRDFHVDAGADVSWQPFEGGHEIPLVAWRALRAFLGQPALSRGS
jgi:phospholipase/carboxylesterase